MNKYLISGGIILIIALFVALDFMYLHIKNLNLNLAIAKQNTAALSDSIRTIQTKAGQESVKYTLVCKTVSDLAKLNSELARQVKNQSGQQVHSITTIQTAYSHDTIHLKSQVLDSQALVNYQDTNGACKVLLQEHLRLYKDSIGIVMDKLQVRLDIITGIIQDPKTKLLSAFARCEDPRVKFTALNSVSFDVQDLVPRPNLFLLSCKWLVIGVAAGGIAEFLLHH
jgi:hypothetical protein